VVDLVVECIKSLYIVNYAHLYLFFSNYQFHLHDLGFTRLTENNEVKIEVSKCFTPAHKAILIFGPRTKIRHADEEMRLFQMFKFVVKIVNYNLLFCFLYQKNQVFDHQTHLYNKETLFRFVLVSILGRSTKC